MSNLIAALTRPAERIPPRAPDAERRRETGRDEKGFDDAFAERARVRGSRRADAERVNDDRRGEGAPLAVESGETKRPRAEPARRAAISAEQKAGDVSAPSDLPSVFTPISGQPAAAPLLEEAVPELTDPEASAALIAAFEDAEIISEPQFVGLVIEANVVPTQAPRADILLASAAFTPGLAEISQDRSQGALLTAAEIAIDVETEIETEIPSAALIAAPLIAVASGEQSVLDGVPIAAASIGPIETRGAPTDEEIASDSVEASLLPGGGGEDADTDVQPANSFAPLLTPDRQREQGQSTRLEFEPSIDAALVSDRNAPSLQTQSAPELRNTPPILAAQSTSAAAQVVAAIRAEKGSNEIEVRLDPPELGRVRINLTFERTDIVTATVSSERTDTLDLLRRHQDDLKSELERAGFSKVRLDFSAGDSGRAFSEQARSQQGFGESRFAGDALEDAHIQYLSLRTDNRLDRLV